MKLSSIIILLPLLFIFSILIHHGCTQQQRIRVWGGKGSVSVLAGQKVINVTWKDKDDGNLWILTRPMRGNEKPETFTFRESSSWGILEGTIEIIEKK